MEKNTAEIANGKKKKRTQAREGGRECETKKPWGVEVVGGMEGAALENTKFPSLKPSSLTG